MPSLHRHGAHFSWIDIATMAGIGGVFVWLFWRGVVSRKLIPVNDPRLRDSIDIVS